MATPKSEAVRAYAEEWSRRLVDDFRDVGVVRDVLARDTSGGVARILEGMLALSFRQSFLLATSIAHQESRWAERGWVDELLEEERTSLLQVAGYGPVPLSSAQAARPRLDVPQAIARLRELEAQATAADRPGRGGGSRARAERTEDQQMPLHQDAEARADHEAAVAELPRVRGRLDTVIGRVLDEFLAATGLQGQYTIGASAQPPAWWLGNATRPRRSGRCRLPSSSMLSMRATAPRRRPSRYRSRVLARGRRRTCARWATCSIGKPGAASG